MRSKFILKTYLPDVGTHAAKVIGVTFRTVGVDVRKVARRSLKKAPRKTLADLEPWEKAEYHKFVKRRAKYRRQLNQGKIKEIPKTYRRKPKEHIVFDESLKRPRRLFGDKSAKPGNPPYLHQKRGSQVLKRQVYWDVKYVRLGRIKRVKNVIVGPRIAATKSPDSIKTPRYIEYGRRRGGKGHPWMRLAFSNSLSRLPNIIRYASKRVGRGSRSSKSRIKK